MSMLRCFGSTVYQITRVATSEFRFKSRELSFHVSDLNGAKEGCQAARKGDFLRPNQRAAQEGPPD